MKPLIIALLFVAPALYAQSVLSEKDVGLLIQPQEKYSGATIATMWQWQIRKDNEAMAQDEAMTKLKLAAKDQELAAQAERYWYTVAFMAAMMILSIVTTWALCRTGRGVT